MKIVVAPDSYKDCLRSAEVAHIICRVIQREMPGAEVVSIPMADGGEGTVEAMTAAASARVRRVFVKDPLGRPTAAAYAIVDDGRRAVMEMAAASGLELLAEEERNPLRTSSFGTGQMIADAIAQGIRDIVIGIGGSATVDGGVGMAQALGFSFRDADGTELADGGGNLRNVAEIVNDQVIEGLCDCRIRVACDVRNPLVGPYGAARVFGPQKGATPEMVEQLEAGLVRLQKLLSDAGMLQTGAPGDGAAGGLGAGLRAFCDAELVSGARLVADVVHLEQHLAGAALVITGEGRTDDQTESGKLCSVVADIAHEHGVPVALLSGSLGGDPRLPLNTFDVALSVTPGPCTLRSALESVHQNLEACTTNLLRALGLGMRRPGSGCP